MVPVALWSESRQHYEVGPGSIMKYSGIISKRLGSIMKAPGSSMKRSGSIANRPGSIMKRTDSIMKCHGSVILKMNISPERNFIWSIAVYRDDE